MSIGHQSPGKVCITTAPKLHWKLVDNQGKPFKYNGKTDLIPGCPMTQDEAAEFAVMQCDASSQNIISAVPCDPPE